MSRERYPFPKEMELTYDEGIFARSALTACLTDDECRLAGIPDTAAGRTVLDFLSGMGYELDYIDDTQVNLVGRGYAKPAEPTDVIDCAGSSDLAHLFTAWLCGWQLYGVVRCANPYHSLEDLAKTAKSMGGGITGRTDGCAPPWCVYPSAVAAGEVRPVNSHPSLRSALALIFLLGQGTGAFPSDTPGSDSMERAIRHYRGEIRRSEGRLFIKGGERVLAKRRDIPRSFRVAVAAIVMTALASGNDVRLPGVCLNPARAGTLEILGSAGIDFNVENMTEIDGEIAADIIVKPSELRGIELSGQAVRSSYEDLGPLLASACLGDGLSEFDLSMLSRPEKEGAIRLVEDIAAAAGAAIDTGGDRITIEGNPGGGGNAELIPAVTDYPAKTILALCYKTPAVLEKSACIDELGKNLAQVILGELLF